MKSNSIAGLLQILLPGLGVGRLYLGDSRTALLQIASNVGCGMGMLWTIADGVLLLAGAASDQTTTLNGTPRTNPSIAATI